MKKLFTLAVVISLMLLIMPEKVSVKAQVKGADWVVQCLAQLTAILPELLNEITYLCLINIPALLKDIWYGCMGIWGEQFIGGIVFGITFCSIGLGILGLPFCLIGSIPMALLGAVLGVPFGLFAGCMDWCFGLNLGNAGKQTVLVPVVI